MSADLEHDYGAKRFRNSTDKGHGVAALRNNIQHE